MFNFNEDDDPTQRQPNPASRQFTTGPNPVTISGDWRRFDFGFRANSVSVRSDAPVVVAVARPYENPDRHITLTTDELPFSLGGDTPVNAKSIWVKRAPLADQDPNVQIIAL